MTIYILMIMAVTRMELFYNKKWYLREGRPGLGSQCPHVYPLGGCGIQMGCWCRTRSEDSYTSSHHHAFLCAGCAYEYSQHSLT